MPKFCIQEHNAEKAGLHWDFRIEINGVLKSWAIPKHRLPKDGERLLAVPTEDHPMSYLEWSGTIEEGYGKGTVKLIAAGDCEISPGRTSYTVKLSGDLGSFKLWPIQYGKMAGQWMITRK